MKQINVCYKHSDLLRQARERCILSRDGAAPINTAEPAAVQDKEIKKKTFTFDKKAEEITFSLDTLTDPGSEALLGSLGGPGHGVDTAAATAMAHPAGSVTSIVYTDEGGREQKMVGKIVVACSDDKGQSNIIIQEVDEEEEGDKIVKLNFSDIDGYMAQMQDGGGVVSRQVDTMEDMEQRLEMEMEGREARIEAELDLEAVRARQQTTAAKVEAQVVEVTAAGHLEAAAPAVTSVPVQTYIQVAAAEPLHTSGMFRTYSAPSQVLPGAQDTITFYDSPSKPVLYPNKPIKLNVPKPIALTKVVTDSQILKIQYRDYNARVLAAALPGLVSSTQLADTVLVCGDGRVVTSSLLLAPALPWLTSVLDSVLRIDEYKTVLLPAEVTVQSVLLLTSLLSAAAPPDLSPEEAVSLRDLCCSLHCSPGLLQLLEQVGAAQQPGPWPREQLQPAPAPATSPLKRKLSSSPNKKKAKQARVAGAGQQQVGVATPVKLERAELNPDYLDTAGLVRLSSADEMAMHYCLYCEAKFKKYNQAITHYDKAHSLEAALACDMCDDTFRDMYTCVKHKHVAHGQFDVNFQCYLCKEVLYSRFRLGTHIKESHKAQYEECMCRACGMKFAAKYYLTKHQEESHSDAANTCGICGKTFSGRRYLTMHIKANHESQGDKVKESEKRASGTNESMSPEKGPKVVRIKEKWTK